jgi:thioredoxin reductase/ferredoxin/pSer/pThr/pTyr-binding forkhead associated (FHA) protein
MSEPVTDSPDGLLAPASETPLPPVLDLLVVGGGPAGTAAAFHAKELGLSALVVDYDDLMKRIRDYPKDKLILPNFGGGDQMRFPNGGASVTALHFPPIDKDEMCVTWKEFYQTYSIPAQVGIELLGIERQPDNLWKVKAWNHNSRSEQVYSTKHIALAIGRGVPRRFDIPGNSDGIAYRLSDAEAYVGTPTLVIGGGTSAAEAAIAISHAKIKGKDPSLVYWSYRGAQLPKVSKALADAFFEAYLGNGNIRYLPGSEPVAIVQQEDRQDYLSLRVDRKRMIGRPDETTQMEFPKTSCIACIGEDIPEALLNSMGIFMATGGPTKKKRMVVTPLLETQQPNVYLMGDILSQIHLETDDFQADPDTFREIKHRGNIKAALRDGVLVAKVVAKRVAGLTEFSIDLDFSDGVQVQASVEADEVAPTRRPLTTLEKSPEKPVEKPVETTGVIPRPAEVAKAMATPLKKRKAFLVRLLAGNVEENEYPLALMEVTTIGREGCDLVFPDDSMLAERHASIVHNEEGFLLREDGGVGGIFLQLPGGKAVEVAAGEMLRLGRQALIFDATGFVHYGADGKERGRHSLPEVAMLVGRGTGAKGIDGSVPVMGLDETDKSLSRRHLSVAFKGGKCSVKDLQSANGTFLKINHARKIVPGDVFYVGQQRFKLNFEEEAVEMTLSISTKKPPIAPPSKTPTPTKEAAPTPAPARPAPAPAPASAPAGSIQGRVIAFKNRNKQCAFTVGQTLCDIAEKNGIKITAECHAGVCGSDPVRIISGGENLNPMGSDEKGTLEDLCSLSPGEHRLACMAKPTGPVELEVL